jgi:hypothetical protein
MQGSDQGIEPVGEEPEDLISISQLIQLLDEEPEPGHGDEAELGTAPVPKVTRMPHGIEVSERQLGHAVGRWVLQVRCDCGRRWFELEPVRTGDCPRCGALVLIDVDAR